MKRKIAVVIPAYKVTGHVLSVIGEMPPYVWRIYVVDDACPEKSGQFVEARCKDPRVQVVYNSVNLGVGGAVMAGYRSAIADDAEVIVKIDGDGQMDPSLIQDFVDPILEGSADYTKGNRFYDLEKIRLMPSIRIFGNAALSLMTKFSSGYWNLFDPTNGYTAIHADIAAKLPFEKISYRYFFETDILFRLNTLRSVVLDIPMDAKYGNETSNLKISHIFFEFLYKHLRNFGKRIFYNYYLRNLSLASIELPVGLALLIFGVSFGSYKWIESSTLGQVTSAGTVMIAAMPILTGVQLILAFLGYDIASVPSRPVHKKRSRATLELAPTVEQLR